VFAIFCNIIVFVYVSIFFPWLVIFCELQRLLEEEGVCDFLWDSSRAKKKATCDFLWHLAMVKVGGCL